jgi:hypothetical protein
MRRKILVATALGACVALSSCGSESSSVLAESDPVASPYAGPLHLPLDHSDEAGVLARSGAAGRALECEGQPYDGGSADYDSGLASVKGSAAAAYANWIEEDYAGILPSSGFTLERDDGDRVLLSYDVGGQTKVAVIAFDGIRDWDGHTGWGVESWASCDPAELSPAVTEASWMQVWEDHDGNRVPVTKVFSFAGPEHCDWQDITFLNVGPEEHGDRYLRDTHGELSDWTSGRYDASTSLPRDAVDTGFRREGRALWLVPKKDAAYLVSLTDQTDVERWPAETTPIGCD